VTDLFPHSAQLSCISTFSVYQTKDAHFCLSVLGQTNQNGPYWHDECRFKYSWRNIQVTVQDTAEWTLVVPLEEISINALN